MRRVLLLSLTVAACTNNETPDTPLNDAPYAHITSKAETAESVESATSKDGTRIGFEKAGSGPALVIIGGALSRRIGGRPLVAALSNDFTVYIYDRRGRGDSGDKQPYAVEREIEDLAAVIEEAGNAAYVYGVSSGAALALQATVELGPSIVSKLAIYEPPYGQGEADFKEQKARINELVETAEPGEAAAYFLAAVGTPAEAIDAMPKSPEWEGIEQIDYTLVYDYAILGDGEVPISVAQIAVPTLVVNGDRSLDFMQPTADHIAELVPDAQRKTLTGQTHQADPEVVAPVLVEFFGKH
jgi:pimeloyl-ACP methyl ester carboxylesterase